MFIILKSLTIVLLLSSLITAICYHFFASDIIGVFSLSTITQLVLGWFLRTYIDHNERKSVLDQQTKLISQIEQEATQAPCAHCGEINLIPIIPDGNNDFTCTHCGEQNSVYVNITIAQPTVPIDSQPYEVSNFNTNLEQVKQQVQQSNE